jgi:hypothetical protein
MTSLESSGKILYDEIWEPVRDGANRRKMYSIQSGAKYLEIQKMIYKLKRFPTGGKYLTIEVMMGLAKIAEIAISKNTVASHHKEYKDRMRLHKLEGTKK